MRIVIVAAIAASLGACASKGVLDPTPYEAHRGAVQEEAGASAPSTIDLRFETLEDAQHKLTKLADRYGDARDRLLRDQMILDVLLIGTGAAAVINPLFHGARDATLALSVGAGTLAAGRAYLAPQVRVSAYNAGAAALSCAAGVAQDLQAATFGISVDRLVSDLDRGLAKASGLKAGERQVAGSVLQASVEKARQAAADLAANKQIAQSAHLRLASFAGAVIRGTTSRAMTGSMNLEAALTAIRALGKLAESAPAGSPSPEPPKPASVPGSRDDSVPDDPIMLARFLDAAAARANVYATGVKDAWSKLPACALTTQ